MKPPADGSAYLHARARAGANMKIQSKQSEYKRRPTVDSYLFPDVASYVLSTLQSDFDQDRILPIPADYTFSNFYRKTKTSFHLSLFPLLRQSVGYELL